jgi:hypothetical protein
LELRGARLYRIHRANRNPWWFSSDGSGRFDLPPASDSGTCYLGEDPIGCFVEVFRSTVIVPSPEVESRRISRLEIPAARLDDLASGQCRRFGLTAEIHSTPDYGMTQLWAAALWRAGFDGIHYLLRHDPRQRLAAIALFGPAGAHSQPAVSTDAVGADVVAEAERLFGIRVLPLP